MGSENYLVGPDNHLSQDRLALYKLATGHHITSESVLKTEDTRGDEQNRSGSALGVLSWFLQGVFFSGSFEAWGVRETNTSF